MNTVKSLSKTPLLGAKSFPDTDTETILRVCCWCAPGQTIFKLYPALEGLEISHGICPFHMKEFQEKLYAVQRFQEKLYAVQRQAA